MFDKPVAYDFDLVSGLCPDQPPLQRRLSDLQGLFNDQAALDSMLAADPLVYEFYDLAVPPSPVSLAFGTSIVYAGKVGDEYFMTKGHFHAILDTAEIYYCLRGRGLMLMENPAGEWAIEEMVPGRVVYVPGRWAHRSINTGAAEPMISLFSFRSDAGHDYATIETKGFRKLVIEQDGQVALIDNPRWGG